MNSSSAFSFACSGSMTDNEISGYASYVQANSERIRSLGGWLGGQVEQTMERFNNFVNSRSWELSKRLMGQGYGEYVGRFDVGYLGSMEGQQFATGFMRDYIMSNPIVMQAFLDGDISGYDGEFSKDNRTIGNSNAFYRKAMNGVVHFAERDDVKLATRSHYQDSALTGLPMREIIEIQRTWKASNHHLAANLFDPTSTTNERMKTAPPEEEE